MARRGGARAAVAVAFLLVAAACGSESEPSTAFSADQTPADSTQTTQPATTEATETTEPESTEPPDTTAEPEGTEPPDTTAEPDESAPESTIDPTAEAFQWNQVGSGPVEEGFLDVPLDYDDPDGEQISLYVVRRRAPSDTRIGSLLVNPGGPGSGGSILAEFADQIYGEELLESFDIVGWDPRGTGESEPSIDCVDDYDPYFGIETGADTAEQEAELLQAAGEFAAGCAERSADLLNHISTVDAARDMDAIRAALGEDEISYFGWSYGTQLGATWATLFPETVRAAVLDGALNPTASRVQHLVDQAGGFERTLGFFLADCAADPSCAFYNDGNPEGAFDALLASLEQDPLPTSEGRPPLVDGVFELGVAQALYSEDQWPQLADALAAAQNGDGSGLLGLYDEYYRREPDGAYGNDLEAYFAISCADDPAEGGVEAAVAERPNFAAASRTGFTQAYELVVCASLPAQPDPAFEITGAGAGPILVVGNTGDPATPYEGSIVMAETLEEGVFLSVEANTHTAYRISECARTVIETYLVDLTIPEGELTC